MIAKQNFKLVLLGFIAWAALAVLVTPGNGICAAKAQDYSSDYCAFATLTVQNGTSGPLTDLLVSFIYPSSAAISAQQLHPLALDLRSVTTGFDDVEVIAQDLGSNVSRWWLLVDSIEAGSTISYQLYSGCNACVRNQGIPFFSAASSYATVTDVAELDFTDDFALEVDAESDGNVPSPSPGWWLTKWAGSNGYRFGVVDDGGTLRIRAVLDATTIDSFTAWDGSNARFRLEVFNGLVEILQDGAVIGSGAATATGTVEDLIIGQDYNGIIRNIAVSDFDSQADSNHVSGWGFYPASMAALTYTVPGPATGTIEDAYGSNDAAYTWTHDNTDVTATLSPVSVTLTTDPLQYSPSVVDVLGPQFGTDFTARGEIPTWLPFSATFRYWQNDAGFPGDMALALLPTMIGFLALAGFAAAVKEGGTMIGIAAFEFCLVAGAVINFYMPWYPLIWLALILAAWGSFVAWKKS